jgi:hypothetical protein
MRSMISLWGKTSDGFDVAAKLIGYDNTRLAILRDEFLEKLTCRIMGTIYQNAASPFKKSANGADQRTQIPPEKSKLGKHHLLTPTPIPDIHIDRTR